MKEYREIYDLAMELLIKTNKTFTDVTSEDLDVLNSLLTGFINNVNSLLVKSVKNAKD
jgi:hypothetical protein